MVPQTLSRFPIYDGHPPTNNAIVFCVMDGVFMDARVNPHWSYLADDIDVKWMSTEHFRIAVKLGYLCYINDIFTKDFVIVFDDLRFSQYALFVDEIECTEAMLTHPTIFHDCEIMYTI